MIYAFTNTAFYSPEKAAEKIRAEKITNSTCHKEDKKKMNQSSRYFKKLFEFVKRAICFFYNKF
jgi:hypothetical protein